MAHERRAAQGRVARAIRNFGIGARLQQVAGDPGMALFGGHEQGGPALGVKAGVEPLALWQAVRRGAQGRRGSFEGLAEHLLPGNFDPPDFALRLARKDVDLAVGVGREFDVPMKLANITLAEMTEAMNRGWEGRDSRVAMLLQEERSGVEVRVDPEVLRQALEAERQG